MKSTLKQPLFAIFLLTIFSCEETTIVKNYTGTGEEKTYSIEGHAQKGPFIVGSNVTVSELNDELYPTGRVFFATILNDEGYFEIPGVVLSSPYVQLKVEGSYFSEVSGGVPTPGNLTLYSLADITNTETINVNILTHLEKERVEYLVQEENVSFSDAKAQALEEIFQIFNWEDVNAEHAESLSITSENEGGAALLSVSSILETFGSFEQRLELITNFQTDFTDGVLDSENIQDMLYNSAYVLNTSQVIQNLTQKFPNKDIPDFEPLIQHFLDNSQYQNYFNNLLPTMSGNNINLIESPSGTLEPGKTYWISVNIPDEDIPVEMYIELRAEHVFLENNSFQAISSQWTSVDNNNCVLPYSDLCHNSKRYLLQMSEDNKSNVQIPITFSGHGERVELWFSMVVGGFGAPISFYEQKTFTW